MLARLKMSPTQIRNGILDVDDQVLTVDELSNLGKLLPSAEEVASYPNAANKQMERLQAYNGNKSKLAKPDLYFIEVGSKGYVANPSGHDNSSFAITL
jgi:hypothetical protein